MAETEGCERVPRASARAAAPARTAEPPAPVFRSRLNPASGLKRPSRVPANPGAPANVAVPSNTVQRRVRPSTVPARPPGIAPPIVGDVLRGRGSPLAAPTRALMEKRLGSDLGHVRVHTDARAAAAARSVNALAYTVGSSIVFDSGQYAPGSHGGQRLLAHELTHTLQQRGHSAPPSGQPLRLGAPDSPAEHQAHAAEAARPPGGAPRQAAPVVQRTIRMRGGNLIEDVNEESAIEKIEEWIEKLSSGKTIKWSDDFKVEIVDRIRDMILEEKVYPAEDKVYSSYRDIIMTVVRTLRAEQSARTRVKKKPAGVRKPTPIEPVAKPGKQGQKRDRGGDSDEELPDKLRRTASELREEEGTEFPGAFETGAGRRANQADGLLQDTVRDQVTMGLFSGEVRFRGNTVVEDDVAQGAAYKDLWGNFVRDITSGGDAASQAEAAKEIMAMMHGKPKALLDYSAAALSTLDHLLAILAAGEQARATAAIAFFAAAVNEVAEGRSPGFVEAFSGSTAVFMGANKGGAQALRGAPSKKLSAQSKRAEVALDKYWEPHSASLGDEGTLKALMRNISHYSLLRQQLAAKAASK